jgi:hypothetical protein
MGAVYTKGVTVQPRPSLAAFSVIGLIYSSSMLPAMARGLAHGRAAWLGVLGLWACPLGSIAPLPYAISSIDFYTLFTSFCRQQAVFL